MGGIVAVPLAVGRMMRIFQAGRVRLRKGRQRRWLVRLGDSRAHGPYWSNPRGVERTPRLCRTTIEGVTRRVEVDRETLAN